MGSVVANQAYTQVSAMNFAVYALKADGTLHAWGKSYSFSIGGGGNVDMAEYPDGVSWSQLSSGNAGVYAHFCALQSDRKPGCWGADYAGQISGRMTSAVSASYMYPPMLGAASGPSPNSSTSPTTTENSPSSTENSASAAPSLAWFSILGMQGVVVSLLSSRMLA